MWKVPAQKSFAHFEGSHQQRELPAGCSAGPSNQYMEIQTKGLFNPASQKRFFYSTKESEVGDSKMVRGLTVPMKL